MSNKRQRLTTLGIGLCLCALLASCFTFPVGGRPGGAPAVATPERLAVASATREVTPDSPFWPIEGWPISELDTAAGADYLTDVEKDVVLHLNMARSNPVRYAREFITPMLDYFNGMLYREPDSADNFAGLETREGASAVREAVDDLQGRDAVPLLYPSRGMSLGAHDHARDQSRTGRTGHQGSDGSYEADRVNRYGRWQQTVGENIYYGSAVGREIVVMLIVDDGVPNRGHRINIYNPDFGVVGVAVDQHPRYGNMSVMTLAGGYQEQR